MQIILPNENLQWSGHFERPRSVKAGANSQFERPSRFGEAIWSDAYRMIKPILFAGGAPK